MKHTPRIPLTLKKIQKEYNKEEQNKKQLQGRSLLKWINNSTYMLFTRLYMSIFEV